MHRSVGCEAVLLGVQASAGHNTLYVGLMQLPAHCVQIAKAADVCSKLGNRNGGLHGALQCLVVRMVMHIFTERVTQYGGCQGWECVGITLLRLHMHVALSGT